MARHDANTILFNAAGVGLLIFVAGYVANSFIAREELAPCSKRYPSGLQFSLNNSAGAPLSPIELQARAGFREYGLLTNASVEKAGGAGFNRALAMKLASTGDDDNVGQNGASFVWPVAGLKSATSACLSYAVQLPKDLSVNMAGHLPGLLAEATPTQFDAPGADGFNARMAWTPSGEVSVEMRKAGNGTFLLTSSNSTKWPKQTWVNVEQEILLNTPGKKNGEVRVWINGALDVEHDELKLRAGRDVAFAGVSGATGYTRNLGKAATIKFSPFVVQWK